MATNKSNDKLKELHTLLANNLIALVKSGEAKASDLNVARQFLKDNDITSIPAQSNSLQTLLAAMPFEEDEKEKDLN